MTPSNENFAVDKRLVKQIIHQAFSQRRKKLKTSLRSVPRRLSRIPEWYSARWKVAYANLVEDERMEARPEEFDFDDWVELATDFAGIDEEA